MSGRSDTDIADRYPVERQWLDVSEWLVGAEALGAAAAALKRRGAFGVRAEELVGEAWLRLHRTFVNRTAPYPTWRTDTAARLASRAIDSALIDMLRRAAPRRVIPMASLPEVGVDPATDHIERVETFRDVIAAVNEIAAAGFPCAGCGGDVVVAAALAVVHHVAVETELRGRGDDFARLVGLALVEVAGELSEEALRQRRRRCGPCVRMLVEQAMEEAGFA